MLKITTRMDDSPALFVQKFNYNNIVEDIFCYLLAQTFGFREMNFHCHVCIRICRSSLRTGRASCSFALVAKTRSQ